MSHPTPMYRLIEDRLHVPFVDYVAERRPHTSWRTLAAEITSTTGVRVTHEVLRRWFADRIAVDVTVRA
jgi:stalled ribosome rescue protein Dom34